ncbi:MAG: alpha/beta hydrolase [Saprospiraceae bacterium]|nr:alpha/beta hydrolase [Saprospiraceae bacterium]
MRFSLLYKNNNISYLRLGTGKQLLFCFHGFGDSAVIWYNLEKKIGQQFTLIALDMPFHGKTKWQESKMQMADFRAIIDQLLQIEKAKRFSLAGFSFGGRIVQQLLFCHAEQIDGLFLFSPDGMGTKGLTYATLLPIFVRRAIGFLLRKSKKIIQLVNWLHQRKWIGQAVYWFFSQNINNPQRRERIFFYWLSLDDFEVKLSDFKKKLQETQVPTEIFLGKNDEITPLSIGTYLTADAPNVRLHILESGHQVLPHLPDFDVV